MICTTGYRYFLVLNHCKMAKIANLKRNLTRKRETPSKMPMRDMVKIDTKFSEIVGGSGDFLKPPPFWIINCLNSPDRIGFTEESIIQK